MKVLYLFKFNYVVGPYNTMYIPEEQLNWNIDNFKFFERVIILNYI